VAVSAGSTILGNRYRLDRLVGRGGFATVYLGTDIGPLGRQVAIKVLNGDKSQDHTFVARFEEEARRVAALDHPNILAVFDYGHSGDVAYLVMPFVAGATLHARMHSARLDLREVASYLRQAAAALDYAHARGIIHRDVKPQNMLLRGDGHLFLADFGIAKVMRDSLGTHSMRVVGTLAYMAPEQIQGRAVPASDVYALGCVLFQLLTGQPPYNGPTEQVMYGHLMSPVPSLIERSAGHAPPALQAVVERALAKQPRHRFPSASDLSRALDAALAQSPASQPSHLGGSSAYPTRSSSAPDWTPPFGTAPPAPATGLGARRSPLRGWLIAAVAILSLLLVVAAIAVTATLATRASAVPTSTAPVALASGAPTPTTRPAGAAASTLRTTPLPVATATHAVSGATKSGLLVQKGQTIQVSASGTITVGSFVGSVPPSGTNQPFLEQYDLVTDHPHGALLCRLDSETTWRLCSTSFRFVAPLDGELLYEINDKEQANNTGSFSVTATIYPAP
jgi:eukaryotic-like serine/threonine-protein kinase